MNKLIKVRFYTKFKKFIKKIFLLSTVTAWPPSFFAAKLAVNLVNKASIGGKFVTRIRGVVFHMSLDI